MSSFRGFLARLSIAGIFLAAQQAADLRRQAEAAPADKASPVYAETISDATFPFATTSKATPSEKKVLLTVPEDAGPKVSTLRP